MPSDSATLSTERAANQSSPAGLVFNIMRFAVHDGPGIRTTVFLKGCPLHCLWCHNPESILPIPEVSLRSDRCIRCGACVEACPQDAVGSDEAVVRTDRNRCTACGTCIDGCAAEARELVGTWRTPEEVVQEVLRDRVFFDQSNGGVTFSGGEPLMQHEFLSSALQKCKIHGLHCAVDTTGFSSPDIVNTIADTADLFLYDVKAMDDEVHRRYTGVSNERILANLRLLVNRGASIVVRIPLIPNVNADADSIHKIGAFVKSLGSITEIQLLPYHETGTSKHFRIGKEPLFAGVRPPSWEQIQEYVDIARTYVPHVSIGG